MSIDFNTAGEQREGTTAIPPGSMVLVQLTLRTPKAGREGSAPGLTRANSGMDYLDCEFEVIAGTYKGNKIWNNYNVGGAVSDGQRKAVEISMRSLRAMVEAGRGINPKDNSPTAAAGRRLNAWTDLNGLACPVVVGCEISTPNAQGKRYVNNTLERIVTPDKPEYSLLMDGGEVISDKPLPEIPAAAAPAAAPVAAWAKPTPPPAQAPLPTGTGQPPANPLAPPPLAAMPTPGWAKPGGVNSGQVDQVPF